MYPEYFDDIVECFEGFEYNIITESSRVRL